MKTSTGNQVPAGAGAVDRIPVTLLTGFLGSGKTTVLNRLLHSPGMAGTAVLINELGEVGIDHHLVEQVDESTVILDSGCVCCTVREDLVDALKSMATRVAKREIPPISRVLIETTGLADPVPVVYTLTEEKFIAARFRFESVVTVVSATHASEQLDQFREAMRQVAMADHLLISKCDLSDSFARRQLDARLAALNPGARRTEITHGAIDPEVLFGNGIYSAGNKLPDVAAWLGEVAVRETARPDFVRTAATVWPFGRGRPRSSLPAQHSHGDSDVSSFVLCLDDPFKWYGFAVSIGRILEKFGAKILRLKGLIPVAGDSSPWVVHAVHQAAYRPVRLPEWPSEAPFNDHCGRLVFICRGLLADEQDEIIALLSKANGIAATIRGGAANLRLPTRCWLDQPVLPISSSGKLDHDGWFVQPRFFRA